MHSWVNLMIFNVAHNKDGTNENRTFLLVNSFNAKTTTINTQRYSARTIPLQTSRTHPTPCNPTFRPGPIHNRTRQTNGPLRVLRRHIDGDTLRRDVEGLIQNSLDLVELEHVLERRDVRQRSLTERRAAVRYVDHERGSQ